MSPIGDKPVSESQARELVPLKDKPDLLRSVVAEVAANWNSSTASVGIDEGRNAPTPKT